MEKVVYGHGVGSGMSCPCHYTTASQSKPTFMLCFVTPGLGLRELYVCVASRLPLNSARQTEDGRREALLS